MIIRNALHSDNDAFWIRDDDIAAIHVRNHAPFQPYQAPEAPNL